MVVFEIIGWRSRHIWRRVVCASCRRRVEWYYPVAIREQHTGREVGRVGYCEECAKAQGRSGS